MKGEVNTAINHTHIKKEEIAEEKYNETTKKQKTKVRQFLVSKNNQIKYTSPPPLPPLTAELTTFKNPMAGAHGRGRRERALDQVHIKSMLF